MAIEFDNTHRGHQAVNPIEVAAIINTQQLNAVLCCCLLGFV
jgi:hypothetical protein